MDTDALPLPLSLGVLRAEDLLTLAFDCVNLRLESEPGAVPTLVRDDDKEPAYLIVRFPPQHLGEQVDDELPETPVESVLAGESRLVFAIPDELLPLRLMLANLLAWDRFTPVLSPLAVPPGERASEPIVPPAALETAIELPYRLILSPDDTARWEHSLPPAHDGWSELWHTRLVPIDPKDDTAPPPSPPGLRAIWSPDYQLPDPPPEIEMPLTPDNRHQIVRLTSDFGIDPALYTPTPARAEQLMLSSLGGWLRLRGDWQDHPTSLGLIVEEWRHIATMGRDQYVKVVEAGYLFPLGHRASLVRITEREISNDGDPVAGLILREFIVIREPEKDYPLDPASGYEFSGREMPFQRVRFATLATPPIDREEPPAILAKIGELEQANPSPPDRPLRAPFWPVVNGAPFPFQLAATDREGRAIDFTMPLIFVYADTVAAELLAEVQSVYDAGLDRSTTDLRGQTLAFAPDPAPSPAVRPGATALTTQRLRFKSRLTPGGVLPVVDAAQVSIPAVEQLLGPAGAASGGTMVSLAEAYLRDGYAPELNKAQVFVQVLADAGPPSLQFPAEKAGGMLSAGMNIVGVSQLLGPVGGPAGEIETALQQAVGGTFDPTKFFGDAKILGGISLAQLVAPANTTFSPADFASADVLGALPIDELLGRPDELIKVPMLTTRTIDRDGIPTAVEAQYLWKPRVKDTTPLKVRLDPPTQLVIRSTVLSPLDGTEPTVTIEGWLVNFELDFFGLLNLAIEELTFTSRQGRKPEIGIKGLEVSFRGASEFVNTLQEVLASILGGGVEIGVSDQGVTAGYRLALPTLGVGVFSLQNLAIAASLSIPFVDKPAGVRFAVAERQHPFLVTVSLFGGGGFFAIELDAGGNRNIEASIEFGGNVSINLGVASGGVYVMAGIYFAMIGDNVKLSGYLRCGGSLEVLGLITISAEFYMSLTYDVGEGKVWGQASLEVCVEILFFSKCVSLSVERKFAGPDGDPTFEQLVDAAAWEDYCLAFAA